MPKGSPMNLNGKRFGKLTVINFSHSNHQSRFHLCQCDCGNQCTVRTSKLTTGYTKSCGCLRKEKWHHIHGLRTHRLYGIWANMKTRCYNKNDEHYSRWGGRGIIVCDEWRHDFKAFYDWAMSNGYAEDLTIDRINNDGNYEPSNCRWATVLQQNNNKRNVKKRVMY